MVVPIHLYFEFSYIPFYIVSKNKIGENKIIRFIRISIFKHINCFLVSLWYIYSQLEQLQNLHERFWGPQTGDFRLTGPIHFSLKSVLVFILRMLIIRCESHFIVPQLCNMTNADFASLIQKTNPLVALNYKQEVLKTNILVICLESQQNETNISDF